MMTRDEVILGLECRLRENGKRGCSDCPYDEEFNCIGCDALLRDALELLKEQEPVEPTIGRAVEHDGHDSWWYQCGKCEKPIDWQDNYCRHCGQAVKWDG